MNPSNYNNGHGQSNRYHQQPTPSPTPTLSEEGSSPDLEWDNLTAQAAVLNSTYVRDPNTGRPAVEYEGAVDALQLLQIMDVQPYRDIPRTSSSFETETTDFTPPSRPQTSRAHPPTGNPQNPQSNFMSHPPVHNNAMPDAWFSFHDPSVMAQYVLPTSLDLNQFPPQPPQLFQQDPQLSQYLQYPQQPNPARSSRNLRPEDFQGPAPTNEETEHYLKEQLRKKKHLTVEGPLSLASLPDSPPGVRPPWELATLVDLAIFGSPQKKLTLEAIVEAIRARFEYYHSRPDAAWKGSIRHKLSLKSKYVKIERPRHDHGKGQYWTVDIRGGDREKRQRKRKVRSDLSPGGSMEDDDDDDGESSPSPKPPRASSIPYPQRHPTRPSPYHANRSMTFPRDAQEQRMASGSRQPSVDLQRYGDRTTISTQRDRYELLMGGLPDLDRELSPNFRDSPGEHPSPFSKPSVTASLDEGDEEDGEEDEDVKPYIPHLHRRG